jgi:REP element-mobilizing transposase RayT
MRKIIFQNDNFYHIYNRGFDKREIFLAREDYVRFLISMREFNTVKQIESLYRLNYIRKREEKESKSPIGDLDSSLDKEEKLVDIICYSLLPNHYHFILKQVVENGIARFMHKLGLAYTMYFNYKYKRTGSLFQGSYKAIQIKSDSELIRTSAYINGNSEIHKLAKAENYIWSSYQDYLNKRKGTMCNKKILLNQFDNIEEYVNLVDFIIKDSVKLKDEIKNSF